MGGVEINGRFHLSFEEEFLNPSLTNLKSKSYCSLVSKYNIAVKKKNIDNNKNNEFFLTFMVNH